MVKSHIFHPQEGQYPLSFISGFNVHIQLTFTLWHLNATYGKPSHTTAKKNSYTKFCNILSTNLLFQTRTKQSYTEEV
jgi:hypothetical protein